LAQSGAVTASLFICGTLSVTVLVGPVPERVFSDIINATFWPRRYNASPHWLGHNRIEQCMPKMPNKSEEQHSMCRHQSSQNDLNRSGESLPQPPRAPPLVGDGSRMHTHVASVSAALEQRSHSSGVATSSIGPLPMRESENAEGLMYDDEALLGRVGT
jgi:hypothetical protein